MNRFRCNAFFHPDRPPVIYQIEIGKVVEKADGVSTVTHFTVTSCESRFLRVSKSTN
ncbi:MAG: hypothetical protein ACJZ02_06525 [Candidatus Neomarinimicrobiota bacterium]